MIAMTSLFLADIPAPAPGGMEAWLLAAAALGSVLMLSLNLLDRVTGRRTRLEQPIQVEAAPNPLSRLEHERHCSEVRRRLDMVEAQVNEIRAMRERDKQEIIEAGERRAERIYDQIGKLSEEIKTINRSIGRLEHHD